MAIITVNKLNALGEIKIQYQGEILEHSVDRIIIQAFGNTPQRILVTFASNQEIAS